MAAQPGYINQDIKDGWDGAYENPLVAAAPVRTILFIVDFFLFIIFRSPFFLDLGGPPVRPLLSKYWGIEAQKESTEGLVLQRRKDELAINRSVDSKINR